MKNNASQITDLSIRTLRIRIKDKHAKALKSMAFDVNQVWNYCNELSLKVFQKERKLMSGYDAGWSQFKTMLMYKCEYTGAWYNFSYSCLSQRN